MARAILNQRARAGIAFRLSGVNVTDVPTRRRIDKLFDVLKLDELPADSMARLNIAGSTWDAGDVEYPMTSEQRDNLIAWLEPTGQAPMTGFMGRVLGPVYDQLKDARDGAPKDQPPTEETITP